MITTNTSILIQDSNIETAWKISNQIPEFEAPYPMEEYNNRLKNVNHKILVAYIDNMPVGFKVGYALDRSIFYSWLGGVLPDFRNLGVAKKLAQNQETWVAQNGYNTIRLKTRNIHKRMLIFALRLGFQIMDVELKEDPEQHRIHMVKHIQKEVV